MYSLTVLEAASPKSRCHQGHAFPQGSREEHFPASGVASSPWGPLLCSCITPVSLTLGIECVSMSIFPLLRATVIGLGLILIQHDFVLT